MTKEEKETMLKGINDVLNVLWSDLYDMTDKHDTTSDLFFARNAINHAQCHIHNEMNALRKEEK